MDFGRDDVPVLDDHDESPDGLGGRTIQLEFEGELKVQGLDYGDKIRAAKHIVGARAGKVWKLSVGVDGLLTLSIGTDLSLVENAADPD